MLAGYYLLYIPAPHMSVDMLLPAALLATECLLRRQTYARLLSFSAVIFLLLLGGMPESAFLIAVVIGLYAIFRLCTEREFSGTWRRMSSYLLIGSVAGVCLGAFVLLPFGEYLRGSFNGHEKSSVGIIVGLLHDPFDRSILTYLFPLLYGPLHSVRFNFDFTGIRNFTITLALFLLLIAIFSLRSGWNRSNKRLNALTLFFSGSVLLVLLKQYGWAPVNSIGRLPLFNLIHFPKYDEPILSISVSIVCAIGLEKLMRREVPRYAQTSALILTFITVALAAILCRTRPPSAVSENPISASYPLLAIGIPLVLLSLLTVVLISSRSLAAVEPARRQCDTKLGAWICTLVTAEVILNFVCPVYYRISPPPPLWKNPYAGAPYIDYLKNASAPGDYRFFGTGVLTPNWASVFHLYDIRDFDALYPREYLTFVRAFLGGPSDAPFPDLIDKFTGLDKYSFGTSLKRRLLQLSSVKYIAAGRGFDKLDAGVRAGVPFKLIYDREAKIYEYDDVLPRAGIFYQAHIEPGEAEVLSKLRDPNLDVMKTVVIAAPDLDREQTTELARMSVDQGQTIKPAAITSYKPSSVEIVASLERRGILVLNDTAYPGWMVDVDGRAARWFKVDYIFRGVLLGPGRHTVRYTYQAPGFYLGSCISLATLVLLGIAGGIQYLKSTDWRLLLRS